MEPDGNARQELAIALRELRMVLGGLRLGGIRDFMKVPIPPAESKSVTVPDSHTHESADPSRTLLEIGEDLGECRRCRLHSGRNNLVFADGSPRARLVFVGEGPGFDEDRQGLPFVGRAGKLLDRMIRAIGLQRNEAYICNVVKCRPPGNRTPGPDEIEACSPFLFRQIEAVAPNAICALGACAAQTLLKTTLPISRLRGKVSYWRSIPLICTFHPAYLLRNPALKAAAWQDLLEVHRLLSFVEGGQIDRGSDVQVGYIK